MVGAKTSLIKTWWANLVLTVALAAATYGLASWAIDSGSMWAYGLTIVALILAVNRLVATIRAIF